MCPTDLPPRRSLDAGQQHFSRADAADDGQARPPSELLDNLRLRLSQLAGNHPSAPGDRPRDGGRLRAADLPPDDDEPGDAPPQDGQRGDGAVGQPGDDQPGDGAAGQPGDGQPGDEAGTWPPWVIAAAAGEGLADLLDGIDLTGSGGDHEPYSPWFVGGEPGSPWWAAGGS